MAANKHEKDMNVTSHLSELRNRLIITAILFVLLFIAGFIFVKDIYCFLDFVINIKSYEDIIWSYYTMAALIAIIVTLAVLCLKVWLYIKQEITLTEMKASLPYIPAIFLLYIAILTFGYSIFIKLILP